MRSTIILLAILFASSIHGQNTGLGLKGGVVASSVRSLNIKTSPIIGGTVGLYLPWGIGPKMELQPELAVTSLGAVFMEPDGDRSTLRSIYMQVPLSLKLYLNNTVHFSGGYQFGKLLYAGSSSTKGNKDITDRYESIDMGFIGGIGVDLISGLDINLRAYGAMTPSLRNDDALFPKNRALQCTVGYRIVQFKHNMPFHKRR